MAESFLDLGGAGSIGTAKRHLVGQGHHRRTADRTGAGEQKGGGIVFSGIPIHPDDLRDDLSGLSDPYIVPHAHVLARHLVLIVEARPLDHRAREMDGLENRHGGESSRAAHGDDDLPKKRSLFLRGILEGHCPAGCLGSPSQNIPETEVVRLDHHTISDVGQRKARLRPMGDERAGLLQDSTLRTNPERENRDP